MKRSIKRFAAVVAGFTGALVLSVAMAAWVAGGSGNGYAKAGSAQSLTTSAVAVTSNLLFPGGSGDVKVTINNPNPYLVHVTTINQTASSTITSAGGSGTCTTNGVSFTNQSGSWAIPANGSSTVTLANAASMSNASDDGCQGATFTIPVTLSGTSN